VCRASYTDPRVIDHFLDGVTIDRLREEVDRARGAEGGPNEVAVPALIRRGLRERAEAA
jgi:hypothetical protein